MNVQEHLRLCLDIFERSMFPQAEVSAMCRLHDAFQSGPAHGTDHNCLGCNFNEATCMIRSFLKSPDRLECEQDAITGYTMYLYLLVERFNLVVGIIQLPEEYRQKHFKIFQDVHKWANFFKHPGAFLFAHHPDWVFEGSSESDRTRYKVQIDQAFVYKHYSGVEKNKLLWTLLKNERSVAVIFPEPSLLTQAYCEASHRFIDLICNNPVYREVLSSRSTLEGYFADNE